MLDIELRVEKVKNAIESKKGEDIKVIDTRSITPYYDYSIICTASSNRNALAILDEVKDNLDILKSVEGQNEANWILVDGGDILVNIFTKEARQYYNLESIYEEK